jgi:hypothetical protein
MGQAMARRSARRAVRGIGRGLSSLTLDPSPRMRTLQQSVQKSNTVAETWRQVGLDIRAAMDQVTATDPT